MRLWSLHPEHLDGVGLVACWRETLLAQKVLRGLTTGYRRHPQLERFRAQPDPLATIATYLHHLADDADRRGYAFDRTRITTAPDGTIRLPVTDGQLALEWHHLQAKLAQRSPDLVSDAAPRPHPLFEPVPGPVATWERALG